MPYPFLLNEREPVVLGMSQIVYKGGRKLDEAEGEQASKRRGEERKKSGKHFQTEILEHQKERLVAQGLSLEMALDIQLLYWCLDQLPEKQGDALLLFEISGFSIKEIAHIQKSKENAVKTRLSRARQKLKELMAQKPNVHSTLGILGTLKTITL